MEKILYNDSNVIFAYLFGGLSQGEVRPLSDIDIAVYVKEIDNLAEYKLQLFDHISKGLGTPEIDLIILNSASTSIRGRILHKKRLLVDKDPLQRHLYESITLREFFDFKIKEDALLSRRYGIG